MKKLFWIALAFWAGNTQAQEPEKTMKAYLVSNAHLDTQWNWDIQTTINEYVKNTANRTLFLLDNYPDYIANFEGAVKYYWIKEYYPQQYERIKQYIKSGRWHIPGGGWDANDVLVPSSESLIRNILLGQTYYREEFGTESSDIYLPDCFGFGWNLPTVAAHCGLIGFSSQKLQWRVNPFYGNNKYPFTIGLWQGIDGKRIMHAHGYNYGERWEDGDLSESQHIQDIAQESPLRTAYRYYGTGDIGGAPTIESVRAVIKGTKGEGPVEIISATSDQLYKDYLPFEEHPELPVFNGELAMDVHGTGCYTSQAAMKLYNRQNELLGDAAERAALAAEWLGTSTYPSKELTESWRRFIFHQFHDDLTGTSIPRAYEFSWNDELLSLKQFSDILTRSVDHVSSMMDTRVKGVPVVIYNANGFAVTDLTEIELDVPNPDKHYTCEVYAPNGRKVASQVIGQQNGKIQLLAEATLPANGYAVYDVRFSTVKPAAAQPKKAAQTLENSIYKISLDANGDIVSLVDKRHNQEIVKAGKAIRLALFTENKSYAWPAWEVLKETVDRDPVSITGEVKMECIEDGALRKTLCIEKKHGKSVFKQYIRLYEGSRAPQIDFYNEVDWQSKNALLKAEFALNLDNEKATYDLGLGSIQRGNNILTAYEVYSHLWTDLTDGSGKYGVSVLNDSKYGWDKPDNNTIRLTLLHTPSTSGNFVYQDQQDLGHHVFTYSLMGHADKLDKPAVAQRSAVLNQPLKAFRAPKHKGSLGKEFSFAQSDNDKVMIKALKKAEASDEYVVRVYEMEGKAPQTATLTFSGTIEAASEADGTEKTIGTATAQGNRLEVSIDPYSVKTYKIKLKKEYPARPLAHEYLPLDFNHKCFSWNEFGYDVNFESGYSYAAELLPDSILTSNGIPFRLGDKNIKNGMTCKGNVIRLPENHAYNRVYLLAASMDADNRATFTVGDRKQEASIPYYSEFIGQWGHSGHTEGYLKDAEVAHVGTHRHSDKGDEAYEFTYMFKVGLDVPEGATQITLPENDRIVIFAATLVQEDYPAIKPACTLFRTALPESKEAGVRSNLLKDAKVIACSGQANEKEAPAFLTDGSLSTKWCDTSKGPNFVDFDLGAAKNISGWKIVHAGHESAGYTTRSCFLQGKNSLNEEWKTIDRLTDNHQNKNVRSVDPASYRYIRLLVTYPAQDDANQASRIYELEVYE